MSDYKRLTACLCCRSRNFRPYLDLGMQPLANANTDHGEALPVYPLGLNLCRDCFHSQLPLSVDPAVLFRNYQYVSGTTRTLDQYFADFTRKVEVDFGQTAHLDVMDIASNDGSLLRHFVERGHTVLGVDPAENLRPLSQANGVETLVDFWREDLAARIERRFDAVVAMNVVAHVPDPIGFLRGVARVLKPGGRFYVQTSQARMFDRYEFDTIYHEHLSFFTARSFLALCESAGLKAVHLDIAPVHGDSYLWTLSTDADASADVSVTEELARQSAAGFYTDAYYDGFARRVADLARDVKALLEDYRRSGVRIAGFGAAAKGMTFLNYAQIPLDFIVDENPIKIGRYAPGINVPIVGMDRLRGEEAPTAFLIMAWNFATEIMAKVRSARPNVSPPGDIFVTYYPEIRIVRDDEEAA